MKIEILLESTLLFLPRPRYISPQLLPEPVDSPIFSLSHSWGGQEMIRNECPKSTHWWCPNESTMLQLDWGKILPSMNNGTCFWKAGRNHHEGKNTHDMTDAMEIWNKIISFTAVLLVPAQLHHPPTRGTGPNPRTTAKGRAGPLWDRPALKPPSRESGSVGCVCWESTLSQCAASTTLVSLLVWPRHSKRERLSRWMGIFFF